MTAGIAIVLALIAMIGGGVTGLAFGITIGQNRAERRHAEALEVALQNRRRRREPLMRHTSWDPGTVRAPRHAVNPYLEAYTTRVAIEYSGLRNSAQLMIEYTLQCQRSYAGWSI